MSEWWDEENIQLNLDEFRLLSETLPTLWGLWMNRSAELTHKFFSTSTANDGDVTQRSIIRQQFAFQVFGRRLQPLWSPGTQVDLGGSYPLPQNFGWQIWMVGKFSRQPPFLCKLCLSAFNNCNFETEITTNEGAGEEFKCFEMCYARVGRGGAGWQKLAEW